MMKRLVCLYLALTLALSLPMLAMAQSSMTPDYTAAVYGVVLDDATGDVTVSWHGKDVTHVVVEAYSYTYDGGGEAVYTKIASVTQAVTPVTYVTPEGVTVQEANQKTVCSLGVLAEKNVRLIVWVQNGNQIVSEPFVDDSYTAEMREIAGQKPSDYAADRVVDLSGEMYGDGSFIALKDDVLRVDAAQTTGLTVSQSGEVYTFQGVDSALGAEMSALQPGSVICVVHEQPGHAAFDFYGLVVESVTEDNGLFHVRTSAQRPKLDEYAQASLFSSVKIPLLHDTISTENLNYKLSARADIDLTLAAGHKGWSSAYVQVVGEADFTDITFTVKSPTFTMVEVPLKKFYVEGVPGLEDVAFEFTFEVFTSASGSIVFDITDTALGFKTTVSWAHGIQVQSLCCAPKLDFRGFSFDAEIFFGFGLGPTFEVFTIFTLSLKLYVGPWMHFNINNIEMWEKKQRWHACEGFKCVSMDLTVRITISGIVGMGKLSKDISQTIYTTPHLADWYDSSTFNDEGNSTCPHQAYRLHVKVLTHDGKPVQDANVYYTGVQEHYDKYATSKTGKDGVGDIYLPIQTASVQAEAELTMPNGRTYRFRAAQDFEQKGYQKDTTELVQSDIELRFDTQAYTITFADSSASGAAAGLPGPLVYYRGEGEVVTLPNDIPTLSGNVFRGWSTIKDPNWDTGVVEYAPGEAIDFADPALQDPHVMLYPVWGNPSGTITVLYNANGGMNAPAAQIFDASINNIALSDQTPTRQGWKFLKWGDAPDEADCTMLYDPGVVIPNPGSASIQLYALWELDTFGIYTITYDNNGAPDPVPAPQTQTATGRVVVQNGPAWDQQHTFRGWAIGGGALIPVCFPGVSYHFDANQTLIAVWDIQYRIVEGAGSTWYTNSRNPLRIVGDGDLWYFDHVLIDGAPLASGSFASSRGSTIIDLTPAYLSTLALGPHTIQLVYQDGATQEATFYVLNPPPITGDSTPIEWALALMAVCGALALAMAKRRQKI